MIKKTISAKTNLETRTAAVFVQTASKFVSDIRLQIGSKEINGKSIMGIISLGIVDGQNVNISVDGADEAEAIKELEALLH